MDCAVVVGPAREQLPSRSETAAVHYWPQIERKQNRSPHACISFSPTSLRLRGRVLLTVSWWWRGVVQGTSTFLGVKCRVRPEQVHSTTARAAENRTSEGSDVRFNDHERSRLTPCNRFLKRESSHTSCCISGIILLRRESQLLVVFRGSKQSIVSLLYNTTIVPPSCCPVRFLPHCSWGPCCR